MSVPMVTYQWERSVSGAIRESIAEGRTGEEDALQEGEARGRELRRMDDVR